MKCKTLNKILAHKIILDIPLIIKNVNMYCLFKIINILLIKDKYQYEFYILVDQQNIK